MLVQYWATVCDADPALNQHWDYVNHSDIQITLSSLMVLMALSLLEIVYVIINVLLFH